MMAQRHDLSIEALLIFYRKPIWSYLFKMITTFPYKIKWK